MVCVLPSLCVTVCTCCLVLSPGQHGGVVVIVVVVVVLGGGGGLGGWLVATVSGFRHARIPYTCPWVSARYTLGGGLRLAVPCTPMNRP